MEQAQTLEDFYHAHLGLPAPAQPGVGHFNVLRWHDLDEGKAQCAAYGRKQFYKISLLSGGNTYHYADKSVRIEKNVLLFNNPLVPYHWEQPDEQQQGIFCLFTEALLPWRAASGLSEYPVFQPGEQSVFQLTDAQYQSMETVFTKMETELASDYVFKYEVLRHAALELVHGALRLQPSAATLPSLSAAARIAALFAELLERQFPIESPSQRVRLRFPVEFANQLSLHVNHLNKALREVTGQTTSALLAARFTQEARALLKHTRWTVSEIAWCLGFEELPHFINFFKKNAHATPKAFRQAH